MIDSHCHINFGAFIETYREVIERARVAGVQALVVPSTQGESSRQALKLAAEFPNFIFPAVGQHPTHVLRHRFDVDEYRQYARDPRVVAIGEIGLDAHREEARATFEEQKQMLVAQLELALELDKPVILHSRDAYHELNDLLRAMPQRPLGVIHCFEADFATASLFLDMGYAIGFTGIITYPKNDTLRETVRRVPLDHMLVETDAPFLTPQVYRGQSNEPAFIRATVEAIAEYRSVPFEQVVGSTAAATRRIFRLQ